MSREVEQYEEVPSPAAQVSIELTPVRVAATAAVSTEETGTLMRVSHYVASILGVSLCPAVTGLIMNQAGMAKWLTGTVVIVQLAGVLYLSLLSWKYVYLKIRN